MNRWTQLFHNNGMQELAPKFATQRIAAFGQSTVFYEVEYANGTFIEMWSHNDWIQRWQVPADYVGGSDRYFSEVVINWCHGISWDNAVNLHTAESLQELKSANVQWLEVLAD